MSRSAGESKSCIRVFHCQNPKLPACAEPGPSSRLAAVLNHPAHFRPGRDIERLKALHLDGKTSLRKGHRVEEGIAGGKSGDKRWLLSAARHRIEQSIARLGANPHGHGNRRAAGSQQRDSAIPAVADHAEARLDRRWPKARCAAGRGRLVVPVTCRLRGVHPVVVSRGRNLWRCRCGLGRGSWCGRGRGRRRSRRRDASSERGDGGEGKGGTQVPQVQQGHRLSLANGRE